MGSWLYWVLGYACRSGLGGMAVDVILQRGERLQ